MSTLPPLQYHTLRHGNRQVSIELWPRPGAACLVFYPGTMFCPVQYRTFLHCLWKNGLAVAALHLTGHGINPHRCRFSFDDLLRDGLDAEQWLFDNGMGPLLLAGHSQGGFWPWPTPPAVGGCAPVSRSAGSSRKAAGP